MKVLLMQFALVKKASDPEVKFKATQSKLDPDFGWFAPQPTIDPEGQLLKVLPYFLPKDQYLELYVQFSIHLNYSFKYKMIFRHLLDQDFKASIFAWLMKLMGVIPSEKHQRRFCSQLPWKNLPWILLRMRFHGNGGHVCCQRKLLLNNSLSKPFFRATAAQNIINIRTEP